MFYKKLKKINYETMESDEIEEVKRENEIIHEENEAVFYERKKSNTFSSAADILCDKKI